MSTRYNTGNPIESTDVRDMSDNAKNLDLFSNSSELSFDDRFGVERKTIQGMIAEFDAQILNVGFSRIGTFTAGATLTNPRQTLLWDTANGGDGQEYGWSGAFPKVVPPLSTPNTTGGIAVGKWMSRFDPELRVQVRESLRRSYAEAGYNLVDGSFEAGGTLVNTNDVLLYEAKCEAYSYLGVIPSDGHPVAPGTNPVGNVDWEPRADQLLRYEIESGNFVTGSMVKLGSGITVQDTIDDIYGSVAYLDSYEHLVVSGDWTVALQTALDTELPVLPNPNRTYNISGVVQSKGNQIIGKLNVNPTRAALSSLGVFTFNSDSSKSEVKNNIKLLYCLRAYDLIELLYIRSMGFNMIFHGGDLNTERPSVDIIEALTLMLDNALTANLQVNMTTGYITNEDSQAIGYVNAFKDHPAVWGFSVFDEPTFNGANVTRQAERLAALRPLTEKNLNVTDVIQNYSEFRSGYNPWAQGYDTFFVDAYSHTIAGSEAENIAADLRDMRTAVGVAAAHLPSANIIPMCGLFKHTGFTTNINQIKGTAPVLAKCAGGDFAAFSWDAVEAGLTDNVLTGADLRAVAKSLCTMSVNGKRIPEAYLIGGTSSNPESRPPVSAVGVELMRKRDYATGFAGAGTAFGILKNGVDAQFTTPLLAAGQSIGGLWFFGQFPIAVTNISAKKHISLPLAFIDVTGSKSGALSIHYSNDEGGTVSPAALTYPFVFSSGSPSVNLNFDITSGDFWRGYKLAFAQSVNPPVVADVYRCGIHGFIVVSEW